MVPVRRGREMVAEFDITENIAITSDFVVKGQMKPVEEKKKEAGPVAPQQMEAPESTECELCMDAAKNALLKPCLHVCCCVKWAETLNPMICPICHVPVNKIKGFFVA